MTAFEIVRESIDIIEAAGRYGMEVNYRKKALCPFHDDRNPSLSFKGQRFKCFSCGVGGDVIDLVGHLLHLSPIETLRELNDTYCLRIDIDKPLPHAEVLRRKELAEEKSALHNWINEAHMILVEYFQTLLAWRKKYAPKHPGDDSNPRFLESLYKLDYVEYLLQSVFIEGGLKEKMEFYTKFRSLVEEIEQHMKKENDSDMRENRADVNLDEQDESISISIKEFEVYGVF